MKWRLTLIWFWESVIIKRDLACLPASDPLGLVTFACISVCLHSLLSLVILALQPKLPRGCI